MNTADQTAKAGCRASTTIFLWWYWLDTPPIQSDQLCSIGADMMSTTSLSLSIYNLLLYGLNEPNFVIMQSAARLKLFHLFNLEVAANKFNFLKAN